MVGLQILAKTNTCLLPEVNQPTRNFHYKFSSSFTVEYTAKLENTFSQCVWVSPKKTFDVLIKVIPV